MEDSLNATLYSKIYDFYEENRHEFNAERDPMAFLDSLKNGSAVYIAGPDDEIVASSLSFRYGESHTESGATRVVKNGFGLQRVLKCYQVLNDYLFRWPKGRFFAVITEKNIGSKVNIERCGFEKFEPDATFLQDLGLNPAHEPLKGKNVFAFNRDNIKIVAQQLLTLHESPIIKNKKSGEEICLRVEAPLCTNLGLLNVIKQYATP